MREQIEKDLRGSLAKKERAEIEDLALASLQLHIRSCEATVPKEHVHEEGQDAGKVVLEPHLPEPEIHERIRKLSSEELIDLILPAAYLVQTLAPLGNRR